MNKKWVKTVLVCLAGISITKMTTFTNVFAQTNHVNLALHKQASSSADEADVFNASQVTDGRLDTRWASDVGVNQKWISVDLGSIQSVRSVVLDWERKNVTDYRILVSENGTDWTEAKVLTTQPNAFRDIINFDTAYQARYVKLEVNNFNPTGEKEDGRSVTWATVSLYEFGVYTETIDAPINLAFRKPARSSANEASFLNASLATDGNENTRWASDVGINQKWISVDLGSLQTVKSVVLDWERKNVTDYRILISENGTDWTEMKHLTQKPAQFKDIILLDRPYQTRYIKVEINHFDASGETKEGKSVTWETVSLYELAAYAKDYQEDTNTQTLQEIAQGLTIPAISADMQKWQLPDVPKDVEIEFIGADFEQIIDRDLTIYRPLVDTKVSVNYRLRRGEEVFETPAFDIIVPGQYTIEASDNVKPAILPSIAEWKGHTGQLPIRQLTRIVVNPSSMQELMHVLTSFRKDYQAITGVALDIVEGTVPTDTDIYFTLDSSDKGLKDEGYRIAIDNHVAVEATHKKGAYWATQTLLQMLVAQKDHFPKGLARDYPKYALRGFVLDVGRKPVKLSTLREMIRTLAWYKYNDIQLHLNDNYIWVEEYQTSENPYGAYSAFRLESEIKEGGNGGLNKADLTSKDLYYTKQEFKDLIDEAKEMGIQVVPEIDAPAHALAFTKVRPDLTMTNRQVRRWVDHLEVGNPQAIQFIKDVWSEQLNGESAPFANTSVMHIGADEFEGNNEGFRRFTDELLTFAKENHKTPRVWGSLSMKPGSTPVQSEGVQMNIWNTAWANPSDMYKQGYQLINTVDGPLYIVPGANYYNDYLNNAYLYQSWEPNKFDHVTIPAGSTQMLGSAFAIWNDMIDKKGNGISEYDIYKRFERALPTLSTKMWGNSDIEHYNDLISRSATINLPPIINPYDRAKTLTDTVLKYHFDTSTPSDVSGNHYHGIHAENVIYSQGKNGKALHLAGEKSFVQLPIQNIGPEYTVSFWIKLDDDATGEQIILESQKGSLKAVQKETGQVGFSREGYDYSFNYTLPKNEWVHLSIKGHQNYSELYVNNQLVDTLGLGRTGNKLSTFVLPTERIGSQTKAMKGLLDDLVVTSHQNSQLGSVPSNELVVSSDNEELDGENGSIANAFDKNPATIWHTKWFPNKQELPANILIDMQNPRLISGMAYLPRGDYENGDILEYQLYGKLSEQDSYTLLKEGTFTEGKQRKYITFDEPKLLQYLKLVVVSGKHGFGSAAEFDIYEVDLTQQLKDLVVEAKGYRDILSSYTEQSVEQLKQSVSQAEELLNSPSDSLQPFIEKIAQLKQALRQLVVKEDVVPQEETSKETSAKQEEAPHESSVEQDVPYENSTMQKVTLHESGITQKSTLYESSTTQKSTSQDSSITQRTVSDSSQVSGSSQESSSAQSHKNKFLPFTGSSMPMIIIGGVSIGIGVAILQKKRVTRK
ncbi:MULTISPECIES: discoidin domain-containing protein [unclassified Granulicatella]|uniref:discoidin domain-containing protein n=1 Tax=unclassified Granulicatella TaxID=2630493 RepID=UPI0010742BC9|nr:MULTISPECIES: discoidin domain-containing protein [unclassified Granulicatella]MBF0779549.1 discoidin domain-containing protein [Granulicatella sp. 19428wC4_WM01]TFU96513.1 cell wall anchor protein [Granulicatella sp. WM01]